MKNPYKEEGGFESGFSVERGFSFESGGRKYLVQAGKTETAEGDKYCVGIFEEGSDPNALPLEEHSGLNAGELDNELEFLKGQTSGDASIEEVRKHWMDHAIDKNAERNQ